MFTTLKQTKILKRTFLKIALWSEVGHFEELIFRSQTGTFLRASPLLNETMYLEGKKETIPKTNRSKSRRQEPMISLRLAP